MYIYIYNTYNAYINKLKGLKKNISINNKVISSNFNLSYYSG